VRILLWSVVWLVLLVGAGLYLWHRVRPLPGKVAAAGREVEALTRQLDALEAIAEPQRSPLKGAEELAVFGSPRELRAAYARGVARSRDARALRRHDRLPGWTLRAMPRGYTASLPARPGSDEGQPS
jgi:hypothetical protein